MGARVKHGFLYLDRETLACSQCKKYRRSGFVLAAFNAVVGFLCHKCRDLRLTQEGWTPPLKRRRSQTEGK